MTLHTINKNYPAGNITDCLQVAGPKDAILLIEGGVYNATKGSGGSRLLAGAMAKTVPVYALALDVSARGLSDKLIDGCNLITDAGWVALSIEHSNMVSWS